MESCVENANQRYKKDETSNAVLVELFANITF